MRKTTFVLAFIAFGLLAGQATLAASAPPRGFVPAMRLIKTATVHCFFGSFPRGRRPSFKSGWWHGACILVP